MDGDMCEAIHEADSSSVEVIVRVLVGHESVPG